ncbi:MAG: hypothetical protein JNN00_01315 [Chitinophagaceae bacterium]|nr:hypothetical protein [Chitinophagaceae bacterium]
MKISKAILQTSNPDELTGFYSQVLQLKTDNSNDDTTITIGSTELVFEQAGAADPFYHFAINIPCNKIDEAGAWLTERVPLLFINDYQSEIADFASWHARSAYFFDPAGNIVELIARFDLKNVTDEPFSSSQFLSINEIGIVTDTLEETTQQLLEQYQLSYFDKQAPLPQFKAIGDDEGLFIVVPGNRNWYPTNKPSGDFPMEINFTSNGKNYQLKR